MKHSYSFKSIAWSCRFGNILLIMALLLAAGGPGRAWAQCTTCTVTITAANDNANFTLVGGENVTINSGVDYNGKLTVQGNGVTITNNGRITTSGAITVNSGITGTVITNLGAVLSQKIKLNAPVVINNGNSTTTTASWTGYVGENFTAVIIINNFASWSGQIQRLPAAVITNNSAATWNNEITNSGNLTLTNAGSWNGQLRADGTGPYTVVLTNTGTWSGYFAPNGTTIINNSGTWNASDLNYTGALTLNHTAGSWTANLNPGSALTINNSGAWTKGFNFPAAGPNRFVNAAGATAVFGGYLGTGGATTLINSGTMTMTQGMGNINATSSLTNNRGATFRVTGQFVNFGSVSNSGTLGASGNFTNGIGGTISGPAAPLRGSVTAGSYTQNEGIFGVTGRLDFCDASQTAMSGFDSQTGTVGAATTFCSLAPLPVELTSFTATPAKEQVQLAWGTASEHNSAKFIVERSAKGEAFEAVQEVAGQGNSSKPTAYTALDAKPLPGTSYYRLRQVDADGTATFSAVVAVSVEQRAEPFSPNLYPNPATDRLTMDLTTATAAPCNVRLISLTGQVLLAKTLDGGRLQDLSLAGVPAGLYLLQVRTSQGSTVQRIQRQ